MLAKLFELLIGKLSDEGSKKLFDILDDFLSVQSFITLGAYGTVFYLTWTKVVPPETVIGFTGTLMGYWFGKQQAQSGGQKT